MQRTLSLVLVACLATTAMAQKLLVKSGSFKDLKSEKELDLEFTFDNMTVGKFAEADYIAKKKTEYNDKEPGRGEKFEQSWIADRESRFAPKFEVLFNDDGSPIKGLRGTTGAKYTLVVHTTRTEPGWNIGISKQPAYIDVEYILKEKATGTVVANAVMLGIPGSQFGGYDYDTGTRLAESYAKAAKELRKWLVKNVFG
ncbi:MAG: hypothetical protein IPG69_03410 [Flavobacteriales bacterium]|nr:hypothetical protein [Flavobacteriales bacterium]